MNMRIAIVGTGGVGGYFGAKLALGGNDVTFIARGEHLETIKNKGLRIKGVSEDFQVYPVKATDHIEEAGIVDLVILGVKAWQVKEIAKDLRLLVKPGTAVIPLQNGVLASEELKIDLDSENVIGGLCRIMSKIEAPGVINHFGIDPSIVFGELDNKKTERVLRIKEVFDQSGIDSKIADNIQSDLWKKFITICVSGLLAVSRSTYGELRELKETRQMMHDLMYEIYLLSQRAGIKINPDFVEKSIGFIDTVPYESTSSLTRDVWEGKPSEIEYQNGTVIKLGKTYGMETPLNRFVYNCILPLEIKARSKRLVI
jgi:2-dehydropantoate 2-reductase